MPRLGSHLPHIAKCIKLWDTNKTLSKNFDYLRAKGLWKSGRGNLSTFAKDNGLSFISRSDFMKTKIIPKWDPKKTIIQNSQAIGLSPSCARNYAIRFKLPYHRMIRGFACDIEKKALAIQLCEAGYTYQRIGHLFGTSRQNVEQLIKRPCKKVVKGQLELITNSNSYKGRHK